MEVCQNQKLKLLYLLRILEEETDENHALSADMLIRRLEGYGISAERKGVYRDIASLCDAGYAVENHRGSAGGYYLSERKFQLPELKLLVDLVQSSQFITEKKSRELIRKLASMTDTHEARELDRQVYVAGRVKADNEQMYYTVDHLHNAISHNHTVTFQYYDWDTHKQKVKRHGGKTYRVSPSGLLWDDGKYYLIARDCETGEKRHYRVDKMLGLTETETPRDPKAQLSGEEIAKYATRTFGMFGGENEVVTLNCDNALIGSMIDRFGEEISVFPREDATFDIHPRVTVSPPFYAWILGFSGGVRLTAPEKTVEAFRTFLDRTAEILKGSTP